MKLSKVNIKTKLIYLILYLRNNCDGNQCIALDYQFSYKFLLGNIFNLKNQFISSFNS